MDAATSKEDTSLSALSVTREALFHSTESTVSQEDRVS